MSSHDAVKSRWVYLLFFALFWPALGAINLRLYLRDGDGFSLAVVAACALGSVYALFALRKRLSRKSPGS